MGKHCKKGDAKAENTAKTSKFRVENKARECDERKDELKKRIELKRLSTAVDKLKEKLSGSIKVEEKIGIFLS